VSPEPGKTKVVKLDARGKTLQMIMTGPPGTEAMAHCLAKEQEKVIAGQ
jgi:hypothetical protein